MDQTHAQACELGPTARWACCTCTAAKEQLGQLGRRAVQVAVLSHSSLSSDPTGNTHSQL